MKRLSIHHSVIFNLFRSTEQFPLFLIFHDQSYDSNNEIYEWTRPKKNWINGMNKNRIKKCKHRQYMPYMPIYIYIYIYQWHWISCTPRTLHTVQHHGVIIAHCVRQHTNELFECIIRRRRREMASAPEPHARKQEYVRLLYNMRILHLITEYTYSK